MKVHKETIDKIKSLGFIYKHIHKDWYLVRLCASHKHKIKRHIIFPLKLSVIDDIDDICVDYCESTNCEGCEYKDATEESKKAELIRTAMVLEKYKNALEHYELDIMD